MTYNPEKRVSFMQLRALRVLRGGFAFFDAQLMIQE